MQVTADPIFTQVLNLIPQQTPFRFIDEIVEADEHHIVGKYRFKSDEFFYRGHFPEKPVTPGVILVESMGQVGVVAFGIYLALKVLNIDPSKHLTVFSDGAFEFHAPVYPEDQVMIRAEKVFFRQKKLKSNIEMYRDSTLVASGTLAGIGVLQ
jgi:3-hydroxyacyl-[acyl-carrier-protein] dehydratase